MSESTHNELAAFQDALARLRPAPDEINIARLLFQAGQLSAPRRRWVWPCATAASMMLAATLGFVLLLRPAPQPAERIVTVYVQAPVKAAETPDPQVGAASRAAPLVRLGSPDLQLPPSIARDTERPASGGDYLQLRRAVLARGLDALPPPAPWPAAAPAEDADTLLDMPPGSREPWFLRLKRSLKSGDAL